MEQPDRVLVRLKKVVLIAIFVFVCLLSVLTWRLLSIVTELNDQIREIRTETRWMHNQVADLGRSVRGLLDQDVFGPIGEGVDLWPFVPANASENSVVAHQELEYLLKCLGQPDLRYEYEGKVRSPSWVQMKLRLKGALFKDAIVSAEDFIEKVAAKTHTGAVYYVIDKDGKKTELRDWLQERLQEHRSSGAPQKP